MPAAHQQRQRIPVIERSVPLYVESPFDAARRRVVASHLMFGTVATDDEIDNQARELIAQENS